MNNKQFFETVKKMREAQKEFFRTHTQAALKKSKTLEKVVDDEIERVEEVLRKRREPGLFPENLRP